MSSVLDAMRELTTLVSSALPCAEQIAQLDDSETTALMAELGAIARRVSATSSLVATDIDRRSARELGAAGLAQSNGLRSGPELVQKLTGSSLTEAKRLVRVGGLLTAAESVAPAPSTGSGPRDLHALEMLGGGWDASIAVAVRNEWLSAAQGDALRAGLRGPRAPEFAATWRSAALELIGDAWAAEWSVEEVTRAAERVRASLDARAAEADARLRFESRSLRRRRLRSGNWKWDLELDPETDAALWGPLHMRLSPRLGGPRFRTEEEIARAAELEQDTRTNEQLLVDEFTAIFGAGVAAATDAGAFGKAEPHVSIVVTAEDLRKAEGHAAAVAEATADAGAGSVVEASASALPDAGVAWIDSGQPVSALLALRAICTGTFTPLLFDESGRALDVGRSRRAFNSRQRRALAARDGGCLWPGCMRPPGECEAHHINPWSESEQNRKTETKDGVLLCRYHHLTLHNHGGRVTRQGSAYFLHWPGRPPTALTSTSGVMTQFHVAARSRVAS